MRLSDSDENRKHIMDLLRETCNLPEEQLLDIQVCAFQAIREIIVDACNDGRIYKVHLLFIGFDSEAGNELKRSIYSRSIEKIRDTVSISPILLERTAIQTTNEALAFIAENFKQNSLNSILNYFKIRQQETNGIIRYN